MRDFSLGIFRVVQASTALVLDLGRWLGICSQLRMMSTNRVALSALSLEDDGVMLLVRCESMGW